MTQTESKFSDRMSDEAVAKSTGRTWSEWFSVLDAAGGRNWTHQQIAAHLREAHGVGSWWQQMVTVQYEREAGLRDKHQRPDGYQISVSKTIERAAAEVFQAWVDEDARARWLADPELTIRRATPFKSIRITWVDGSTSLEVGIYDKGAAKSQVTAQQSKLPDAKSAAAQKAYWAEQLQRLKSFLEAP